MSIEWKFDDSPNTASMTTSFILDGAPILRVYHDYEGGWQFHGLPDDPTTEEFARVVSLESMVGRDSTIEELYDLPYGWRAARLSPEDTWTREKNNPFATYPDYGYYLEDAVWMAQYRDDVQPPAEDLRESLPSGTYAKLLFRFAAEDAAREDGQTERMWVLVTDVDEDGYYIGTLDNDPRHGDSLACGDTIRFHSLHVAEILDEAGA